MQIQWKGSPNFDTNRKPIDRVVLHWFGIGTLDSANNRFQNPSSQVSAHYGISGDTVYQWVTESNVAYHAGNYAMNQRSVGIEHDATTEHKASSSTYNTSANLIYAICRRHNITPDRLHIIKHSEIVPTQCCGTLDIEKIVSYVQDMFQHSPSPSCSPSLPPSVPPQEVVTTITPTFWERILQCVLDLLKGGAFIRTRKHL